MPKATWSDDDIWMMLEMRRLGWTAREIGERIGKTKNAVVSKMAHFRAEGIPLPPYPEDSQ